MIFEPAVFSHFEYPESKDATIEFLRKKIIKLESQNDELRNKLVAKQAVKTKRPVAIVKPVKYNPFKKTKQPEKPLFLS